MNIYENNFNRLVKLGIIDESGKLMFEDAVKIKNKPFMDLNIDDLGDHKISMAHNFIQNGDVMCDPDMEIRIVPEIKMVEVLTYQQDAMLIFQQVYPDATHVIPKLKKELNSFLGMWLKNLISQGFKLVKSEYHPD